MSGHSDCTNCPKCGNASMEIYMEYKPHDCVSGECLTCGFTYYTKDGRMSLEELNELRENIGLAAVSKEDYEKNNSLFDK